MESFKVALLFAATVANVVALQNVPDVFVDECFPRSKMCDVDVNRCIGKELIRYGLIDSCEIFQHDVYKTEGLREFAIKLHPLDRPDFPDNVTYSVYRKRGHLFNWSVPLEPVEDCCDMTLDKKCFLPEYSKDYSLAVIIPRVSKQTDDKEWYCMWEVVEADMYVNFCDNDGQKPCIKYTDGFPYRKSDFVPLTYYEFPTAADYCFFPESRDITGIIGRNETLVLKRKEYFSSKNISRDCTTVTDKKENIFDQAKYYTDIPQTEAVCAFVRFPDFSNRWQMHVVCFPPRETPTTPCFIPTDNGMDDSGISRVQFYGVICGATCISTFLIILSIFWCRRHSRHTNIGFQANSPSTLTITKADYLDHNLNDTSRTDKLEHVSKTDTTTKIKHGFPGPQCV